MGTWDASLPPANPACLLQGSVSKVMLCSTRGSMSASICCAVINMVSTWPWGKPVLIASRPWSFSAPFLRNRSPNSVSPIPQTIVTWMLQGQSTNLVWWILTHLLGLTPPGAKDATRQFTQSRRLCRGKVRIASLSSPTSGNAHKSWQAWRAQAEIEVFWQKVEPSISALLPSKARSWRGSWRTCQNCILTISA